MLGVWPFHKMGVVHGGEIDGARACKGKGVVHGIGKAKTH